MRHLEEAQRDLDTPIPRIEVAKHWTGEDHQTAAVLGRVLLQVGLQAQPKLHTLVEFGGLRCCVGVMERVIVGQLRLGDGVAPDG